MTDDRGTVVGTLHADGDRGVVRMTGRYATDLKDLWSALTDPQRLARWYGKVDGELREGGAFTVFVEASGFDGRGRIEACVPPRQLRVVVFEEVGVEHVVAAALSADGEHTVLVLEVHGVPLDVVWAYGAGWQVHLEDLGGHLAGLDRADSSARWDVLESSYREMPVVPVEP